MAERRELGEAGKPVDRNLIRREKQLGRKRRKAEGRKPME